MAYMHVAQLLQGAAYTERAPYGRMSSRVMACLGRPTALKNDGQSGTAQHATTHGAGCVQVHWAIHGPLCACVCPALLRQHPSSQPHQQ